VIAVRIRLTGCRRPTRADFARHMVETAGGALIFQPPAPRRQPIKTGQLR